MFWRERSSCTRITEFLRMVMMPGVVPEARKVPFSCPGFPGMISVPFRVQSVNENDAFPRNQFKSPTNATCQILLKFRAIKLNEELDIFL